MTFAAVMAARSAPAVPAGPAAATRPEPATAVFGFERLPADKLPGISKGELLLGEMNCVACHAAGDSVRARLDSKQPPLLGDVASRVTAGYLRAFLSNPHHVKPGTGMPDLLASMDEAKRNETVEALVSFLATLHGPRERAFVTEPTSELIDRGRVLYHTVGCVACHSPLESPAAVRGKEATNRAPTSQPAGGTTAMLVDRSIPLGDLPAKTTRAALAKFLADPLKVRPSGRMPSSNLKPDEADAIAAYLLRGQAGPTRALWPQDETGGVTYKYYEGKWREPKPKVADKADQEPLGQKEAAAAEEAAKAEAEARAAAKDAPFDPAKGIVPDLKTLAPLRTGALDKIALDPHPARNNFAQVITGYLQIDRAGKYTFEVRADRAATSLAIDDVVVCHRDPGAKVEHDKPPTGSIDLAVGRHPFTLSCIYFGGRASLEVRYESDGTSREEVPAGALYQRPAPTEVAFTPDPLLVEKGRAAFAAIGCASCHQTGDPAQSVQSTLKAKDLARLDPAALDGCLGDAPKPGVPRFPLDDGQKAALREALGHQDQLAQALDAPTAVRRKMAALNCFACHHRDDVGGPVADRDPYFISAGFAEMGDEGRLPPHLNAVGDKLRPAWIHEVLANRGAVRPYMATRMPQFGDANVGSLAEQFTAADAGKIPPAPSPEPAFDSALANEGRKLVGTRNGLGCINCHMVTGTESLGVPALDLQYMYRRLKYDWFNAYVRDPASLRPGTRMPTFWPHNAAVLKDVLGGDTDRQIGAVWTYLSQGDQMPLPPGLMSPTMFDVNVGDEPVLLRTFVKGVGEKAITVGYPEQVHVAFDAETVRLVETWRGKFINAKAPWDQRGGGEASPQGQDLQKLPPGMPLALLPSTDAPWPTEVGRKDETFMRGYRLDPRRWPVFRYRSGELTVEEQPMGRTLRAKPGLVRRFRVTGSPQADQLWYRAAVGQKIEPKDGGYLVDGTTFVRVVLPQNAGVQVRSSNGDQELLVPVPIDPPPAPDQADRGFMTPSVEVEISW